MSLQEIPEIETELRKRTDYVVGAYDAIIEAIEAGESSDAIRLASQMRGVLPLVFGLVYHAGRKSVLEETILDSSLTE